MLATHNTYSLVTYATSKATMQLMWYIWIIQQWLGQPNSDDHVGRYTTQYHHHAQPKLEPLLSNQAWTAPRCQPEYPPSMGMHATTTWMVVNPPSY